ncbi:MAG: hypothetical protein A2W35_04195 [Chloroflexi bacterium RBG_16_57_11]|nr:MAG: hypothetical protein A2W35_04195 [Chloroflexi bacterium RBG_16_57_11]
MAGLAPGNHSILAEVTDSAGNSAADSLEIFVDPYPVVTIGSPANNQHFYERRWITFSGTATEMFEGDLSANIQWYDNGTLFGTGASFDVFDLAPLGLHTITAEVTDAAGQTGSDMITIVIEPLTPPQVFITWPPNNSRFALGDEITFSGTATDAQDGNLNNSISWSSNRDGFIGPGPIVVTPGLSEGWHEITASVTDIDGMTATASINILVRQNQPPSVEITSPNNGNAYTAYQGDALTFSATATDEIDDDLSDEIVWSSDTGQISHTGASFQFSNLSIGTHVITASVQDRHGLTGSDTIAITIVNAPPVVTIDVPADNSYFSDQANVNLRGTATDPGVGSISDQIAWTSSLDAGFSATGASINTTSLSIGVHNIRAYVMDSGGLWDDDWIQLTIWKCPYAGPAIWTTAGSNSSVDWTLNIDVPPQAPSYTLTRLRMIKTNTQATISSIIVNGVAVPGAQIVETATSVTVDGPVGTNLFASPATTVNVVFNFNASQRPRPGDGSSFTLEATFQGCSAFQTVTQP